MKRQLRCSFCKKPESEVAKLVAGPRVYICDACVAVASRIMDGPIDPSPVPRKSAWQKIAERCRRLFSARFAAAGG